MMKYKGYYGKVEYDDEAKIFHGELIGMRAVIPFQGITFEEIENSLKDSIEDYLEWCRKRRKQPEKPFFRKVINTAHKRVTNGASASKVKSVFKLQDSIFNTACKLKI